MTATIPSTMRAMVFSGRGPELDAMELEVPQPGTAELLIKVSACGVCRTDLHVIDGDLTEPLLPVVPGHQIVGEVVAVGEGGGDVVRGDPVRRGVNVPVRLPVAVAVIRPRLKKN